MKLSFVYLDVFTTSPLSGNPLAIVFVPSDLRSQLTEETKQKIAVEFNLSETVFLHEAGPKDEQTEYDIFTTVSRIAFAGHPTIGTAVFLKSIVPDKFPAITSIHTLAGDVPIEFDAGSGQASVQVPHDVHVHAHRLPHPLPGAATNTPDSDTVPTVSIVKGMAFSLVPMADLNALGSISQGLLPLQKVYDSDHLDKHDGWNKGVHGTFFYADLTEPTAEHTHGEPSARVIRTRMFGSREDPGTGSASSALCSYLALQEPREKGAGPFLFHLVQGVEMGRRCDIHVIVRRTADGSAIDSVALRGNAVKTISGEIEFPL